MSKEEKEEVKKKKATKKPRINKVEKNKSISIQEVDLNSEESRTETSKF